MSKQVVFKVHKSLSCNFNEDYNRRAKYCNFQTALINHTIATSLVLGIIGCCYITSKKYESRKGLVCDINPIFQAKKIWHLFQPLCLYHQVLVTIVHMANSFCGSFSTCCICPMYLSGCFLVLVNIILLLPSKEKNISLLNRGESSQKLHFFNYILYFLFFKFYFIDPTLSIIVHGRLAGFQEINFTS